MEQWKETPWGIIPSTWKISTVKEETSLVTDYVANGSFASLAENVKYKSVEDYAILIRLVDYNNNFQGPFVFIDESAYEFLAKSKLYGNEIIISNVGANVGTVFKCPKLKWKMSLAPNSIMVKFKGNNDFYYYWLKSKFGQHMLNSIVTGSAQPKFNKTNFKDLAIPVPPIDEQKRIAAILSSLDDKIELNRRINRNLEQQAQALFKAWFVENSNPQWINGRLSDIASFVGGYSYKGNELVDFSNIGMATIKNYERSGGFKTDGFKDINPSSKLKSTQYAELFDILVAHTDLTQNADVIGNAELLLSFCNYKHIIFSMDLVKVLPNKKFPYRFLLAAMLKNRIFKNHCLGYVNGTTVLHLSKKALPEYEITIPTDKEAKMMNDLLSCYYKRMAEILRENDILENLRNAILPKLMSGKLKIMI